MSSIDSLIESIFGPIADVVAGAVFFEIPVFGGLPIILVWLMAGAIYLTVALKFPPITGFKHSMQVIRGRFNAKTDPGEISSFEALATELSGTVGLGNIAGVAVAITLGGPGAAMWIVLFGLLGMSVKMAEAVLGSKYRVIAEDGSVSGGPMYYLRDGLAAIGKPEMGKKLAWFFALCTLLGVAGTDLFQSNQVASIVADATGIQFLEENNWVIGAVLSVLIGIVIIGGVASIATWTSRITPAMAIIYIASTIAIIIANIDALPGAFGSMIHGMFTGEGVVGGVVGVAIVGIQRALFSNAAGIGTAGFAHAASKTKRPATEGFVAMWEPLVDSVIVCTLTALAIIVTDTHNAPGDLEGVELTRMAFETVASWFPFLLTVAVALFGFSTVLAYAYYGEQASVYLFGDTPRVRRVFRIMWLIGPIVGAASSLNSVVLFADAALFLMTIPNLIGIYMLSKVLRDEVLGYKAAVDAGTISEIDDPELWVGMGDHTPTPQQLEAAILRDEAEARRRARLARRARTRTHQTIARTRKLTKRRDQKSRTWAEPEDQAGSTAL